MNKYVYILSFLFLIINNLNCQNWPLRDADENRVRGRVSGQVGEMRDPVEVPAWNNKCFHGGIDITPEYTTPLYNGFAVYSVNSGTITYHLNPNNCWQSYIKITNGNEAVVYYHVCTTQVNPINQEIVDMPENGEQIASGQYLGVMFELGGCDAHVHINFFDTDDVDNDLEGTHNPIGRIINPYTDYTFPYFISFSTQTKITSTNEFSNEIIEFWKDGISYDDKPTFNYNNRINNNIIYDNNTYKLAFGKVDIVSWATDHHVKADGSDNLSGNNGLYSFDYEILNIKGESIDGQEIQNIKFLEIPSNSNVSYVFDPRSTLSNHIYILTNNPFEEPYNRYWNTKLRIGTSPFTWSSTQEPNVMARINNEAHYKDGLYHLKIDVSDIRYHHEGTTNSYLLGTTSKKARVIIDNFTPYIKKVKVYKNFYNSGYECYNTEMILDTQSPEGIVVQDNGGLIVPLASDEFFLIVEGSEALKELKINIPEIDDQFHKMWSLDDDGNSFFYKISEAATSGLQQLSFRFDGTDYSNNKLERIFTDPTTTKEIMPVRVAEGVGSVAFDPNPYPGVDEFHTMTLGCANKKSGEICLEAKMDIIPETSTPINGVQTYKFIDQSEGATEYYWDFGNGVHSYEASAEGLSYHLVDYVPGNYIVYFEVQDDNGNLHGIEQEIEVTDNTRPPIALFEVENEYCIKGEEVTFINKTVNATQYEWIYGHDIPEIVNDKNDVTHTYPSSGTYVILLRATNQLNGETDEFSLPIEVYESAPLVSEFNILSIGDNASMTKYFEAKSTGEPLSFSWDFGDNTTSSLSNPRHIYAANGTYQVTLETTWADGTIESTTKEVIIGDAFYTVSGVIKSENFALLAGATIQFLPSGTGEILSTQTNGDGEYTYSLPVGWQGKVEACASGFNCGYNNITVNEDVQADITLLINRAEIVHEHLGSNVYRFTLLNAPFGVDMEWDFDDETDPVIEKGSIRVHYYDCDINGGTTKQVSVSYLDGSQLITKESEPIFLPNCVDVATDFEVKGCNVLPKYGTYEFSDYSMPWDEIAYIKVDWASRYDFYSEFDIEYYYTENFDLSSTSVHYSAFGFLYRESCREMSITYDYPSGYNPYENSIPKFNVTYPVQHVKFTAYNKVNEAINSDTETLFLVDCDEDISTTNMSDAKALDENGEMYYYSGSFDLSNFDVNDYDVKKVRVGSCRNIKLKPGVHLTTTNDNFIVLKAEPCLQGGNLNKSGTIEENSFLSNEVFDIEEHNEGLVNGNGLFNLFPNPNEGEFVIEIENYHPNLEYGYCIYNSLGQKVKTGTIFTNMETIHLNNPTKGVHFIRVTSEDFSKISTFIIN